MSNVIDFLARMGQDARLRHADEGELREALQQAQIEPELQSAILGDNVAALAALLGASANICCVVHAPEKDEPPAEEDEPDDDSEDSDGDEKDSSARQRVPRGRASGF